MMDYSALTTTECLMLANSTRMGEVLTRHRLRKHRDAAGLRIGNGKRIHLLKYMGWLADSVPDDRLLPPDGFDNPDRSGDPYERHKERMRAKSAAESAKRRDIGPIPDIADIERREACRFDLVLFCKTYNPKAFKLEFSEQHLVVLKKIEQALLYGGFFAVAMPRGFGKTTICRMATAWAIAYGHTHYAFIIGANAPKAEDNLKAVKKILKLPRFAADFPEIAIPVKAIGGIANRAAGQTCQGVPTGIEYQTQRVVLATVPPPANWPDEWELNDGMVPTSGSIIGVSGLTGDGIRGSLITTEDGEMIRPGFVLLDDPQTDESARSDLQNDTRERLINGAVLGMEGPDEPLSCVMPCTVIYPNDLASRFLDRKRNPLWRGERSGILEAMPTNMDAWDAYAEVFYCCNDQDPPDFGDANAYYELHREELDAGAVASWPDRKAAGKDVCVSAIQFAMHKYFRHGPDAFMAEFMNDPQAEESSDIRLLEPPEVAQRLSGRPRGEIPYFAAFLTAMIDIHEDLLYWSAAAFDQDFTGSTVDYNTWPEQPVPYFLKRNARRTLEKRFPGKSTEAAVTAGLSELLEELFGRTWSRAEGDPLPLALMLIDEGHAPTAKAVEAAVRRSEYSDRIVLSRGYGVTAGRQPLAVSYETAKKRRTKGIRQHGGKDQWYITSADGLRHLLFDTNHWKTLHHTRLLQDLGSPTALDLFGKDPRSHQLISEHLVSESPALTEGLGRKLFQWTLKPGRDNHWLDTSVGCLVAASILGAQLPGENSGARAAAEEEPVDLGELQARARGRRRRR